MDPQEIIALADRELTLIRSSVPPEPEKRFLLLLEIQRHFDAAAVDHGLRKLPIASSQNHDVMRWGMNLATSELLRHLPVSNGIPFTRTSPEFRNSAALLLYKFGLVSLLRRIAEMVRVGMLKVARVEDKWVFRENGRFIHQFMDQMETDRLKRHFSERNSMDVTNEGWCMVDFEGAASIGKKLGAFFTRPQKRRFKPMPTVELEEMMLALMRPWPTPYGTFLAYDADERLDNEFFPEASEQLLYFMEQAGIHPSVEFSGFTARDLLAVCVLLGMIYRKHIAHCLLAAKRMPTVDAFSSFTLWQSRSELIDSLNEGTGLKKDKVDLILSYLSVSPEDVEKLADESVPMLPMIIDLGNGMLLRPVSSMTQNQLVPFLSISKWRDAQASNRIAKAREPWFRQNLYALFRGNRYVCIEGNVLLRHAGRKITDIDAAILDKVTGQLALFQLKWQDYFSNNARQLGSRAKNFSVEVDSWAGALFGWIKESSILSVMQALRLDVKKREIPMEIYMFALSWQVARSAGYGFPVSSPFLSVASWPQFCRVRSEIGPADEVFGRIHEVLREEESVTSQSFEPWPYEIRLSEGEVIVLENIWNSQREGGEEQG